jgi:hypothetical protein
MHPVAPIEDAPDQFGVVDEAVDHGGRDGVVAQDLAPRRERLVGSDDQAGSFVAAHDEHEHEVRGLGSKGM